MSSEKVNDEINDQMDNINESEKKADAGASNGQSEDNAAETADKINLLETEVVKYKELMLRKAAEFENYKRRSEIEQLNLMKYAAEGFIVKLLPITDDLERSLSHMSEETDVQKIKEGIQLIYNKLIKVFDEQGIKKIESIGKPFNVDYHEALMQRKDDSVEAHTVLDELETGYMYKDRVIRHSKVIVSEG